LQSSYEYECSKLLDKLDIRWIRPTYLVYNKIRKYFPDFYLVDYNIYLDPKNSYLIKQDRLKIDCVKEQNSVDVYILTKEQITEEYILMLVSPNGEGLS